MGEDVEEFKKNLDTSFSVFCTSHATFKKIDNVLYYTEYDGSENVYINLSDLSYQDIIVSSVSFAIYEDIKKNEYTFFWLPTIQLILRSDFSDKLVYVLKQKKLAEKYKENIIIGYLDFFHMYKDIFDYPFPKKGLLNLFDLVEISENKVGSIIEKYLVSNDSTILINYFEIILKPIL